MGVAVTDWTVACGSADGDQSPDPGTGGLQGWQRRLWLLQQSGPEHDGTQSKLESISFTHLTTVFFFLIFIKHALCAKCKIQSLTSER